MSLEAPLFHRTGLSYSCGGSTVSEIFQKPYEEQQNAPGAAFLGLAIVSIVANLVFTSVSNSFKQTFPALRHLIWIPLTFISCSIYAFRNPSKSLDLQQTLHLDLQKNDPVDGALIKKIAKAYPKSQDQLVGVVSRMNFLQIKELRVSLGKEKVMEMLKKVNNLVYSLWWTIDLVLDEKDFQKQKAQIDKLRLQQHPLIAFEIDSALFNTLSRRAYNDVAPQLTKAVPELERKVYTHNLGSISLRKQFVEYFAEGYFQQALVVENTVPYVPGIERYLELVNGDEGPFEISTWLEDVRFADQHSQKKMLTKLDATLAQNLISLNEAQKQQFSDLLQNGTTSYKDFPKSLKQLHDQFSITNRYCQWSAFDKAWHAKYAFVKRFPYTPVLEEFQTNALKALQRHPLSPEKINGWIDVCSSTSKLLENPETLKKLLLRAIEGTSAIVQKKILEEAYVKLFGAIN